MRDSIGLIVLIAIGQMKEGDEIFGRFVEMMIWRPLFLIENFAQLLDANGFENLAIADPHQT